MSHCKNCGFPLPEGAEFCPNCGARVEKKPKPQKVSLMSIGKIIQAGILGAFISVMVSSLSPPGIQLYFLPSFLSSIIVIFLFKARRLEEAVSIAFAVYLFADAILGGIIFGSVYVEHLSLSEVYRGYMLTLFDIVMYVFNPVSALIAAYVGSMLTGGTEVKTEEESSYRAREEKEPGGIIYLYSIQTNPRSHKV